MFYPKFNLEYMSHDLGYHFSFINFITWNFDQGCYIKDSRWMLEPWDYEIHSFGGLDKGTAQLRDSRAQARGLILNNT